MQVAVEDPQDTYRPYLPHEDHVGKATIEADKQVTCLEEKRSLICNQRFVAQTIESLLPDEEDLFSGVLEELGHTATGDEDDGDFDQFTSSGGMELEGNSKLYFQPLNPMTAEGLNSDQTSSDYLIFCEHPDQASLEVFNCDSSISNDKLHQIFGSFGEIEEIYGTTHHRCIKYYDIRAAEAAINGLNNDMLQEKIKVEVSHPEHGEPSLSEMNVNNAFPGDSPLQANCCFTNSLPSPVGIASFCKQFLHGPHHPTNHEKFHNHFPSFHPESLPVNGEGFVDDGVITYDPVNFASVGFTMETNGMHLHMVGPYGPPMEHITPSIYKGSLLGGHHHAWSFSNSFNNHHPNPVIWSHSPPSNNGVCANGISNLPALSEVMPPVLYTVSPIHTQNVTRSAPSGSLSCKNLRIAHMEESSKADSFLNPLRVVGFPSTMCPPQIISHKSPKRDARTTSPFSFNRPRGRVGRRISHGRHESVSCHTDEKKYELDIERVLCGEDCRTTLMIKNIPNKYSSAMLLAAIDEQNQGTYDFIYLPLDFKNKCNMGYAFINMIDPLKILQFHKSFNGKKWEKFHSGKVACLAYARIQGKAALIAHFQESSLMNQDKCCHPILFTTDGPNAGNQEPFPLGPSIHSRRHKNGCNAREVNQNEEISPTSFEGETIKNSI